jgi:WD40 repeat protein
LLQYTLTELFERQAGNRMTHSAYQDLGGIAGALARRAEELYDQLDAPAQQVARQVFLRLVVPQETGVTVRQKVTRDALFSLAHPVSAGGETLQTVPAAAVQTVLDTFGRYRLLTFDRDAVTDAPTVEIAHEMLTEAWQSLRVWVTEAQETLYRHRRLEALAAAWERAQRDPSYLLRGRRLAQFEELPTATGLALSATEAAYLKASLHAREARRQQEAARQAHEAELERHIQGRRRALTWVLAVATAVALSLAAYAFVQRRSALDSQRRAEREVVISESLSLSTRAQLAGYNNDTDLAIALAWQANRIEEPPSQVQLILSDVAYAPGTRRVFTGHDGPVTSVTATADGQHLLSASGDGTLILWDVQTGEIVRRFQGHTDAVHSVVLLPGDQQALSASADGSLILWNLATGDIVRRFEGHTGAVRCVTLSPVPLPETGHLAALSGSEDTSLILWDVNTGEIVQRFEGHTGAVVSLAISPDVVPATGRHVALSGAMDRGLIFWDFPGGAILYNKSGYETTMDALDDAQQNGHFDVVWAVGFTSGGQAFSASQDENVMLWDLETGGIIESCGLAKVSEMAYPWGHDTPTTARSRRKDTPCTRLPQKKDKDKFQKSRSHWTNSPEKVRSA